MFKAKITEMKKGDDGFIDTFKVYFTDGSINIESSFDFKDYGFKTDEDIFNFLISESTALDVKYTEVAKFEALINVENVADVLKTRIETVQKEKEAAAASIDEPADAVVTP